MAYGDTGLYPGFSIAGQVPREGLIKKMKAISRDKNIFISAPGGYGKTVAATQWLMSLRGKKAKIVIGDADNDPGVLHKKLAAALLKLTGKSAQTPGKSISFGILLDIVKTLPKKHTRCYIVIDDAHNLRNEESLKRFPVLIERLPEYVRLCLTSRLEPSRALLETCLFETVTIDDLLFSPEEVEWIGAEKGFELNDEQIKELLETTGGWAMYLTALLSHGAFEEQKDAKVSLTQYLETQIWAPAGYETKNLLLTLAVPDEITPELCKRLTGCQDGQALLARLTKEESFYLTMAGTGKGVYRFHDIFREFLLERAESILGINEFRRLNSIVAEWYFEREDYCTAAHYYINNRDHKQINRCISAFNRYYSVCVPVEDRLNLSLSILRDLPAEFINENPFLLLRCAVAAYNVGSAGEFTHYMDILYKRLPGILIKEPSLAATIVAFQICDFRTPIRTYVKRISRTLSFIPKKTLSSFSAPVSSITQNLPFYHRSMRDFSEYFNYTDEDYESSRATYSLFINKFLPAMLELAITGMYYERGELLEATHHALAVYRTLDDDMHPETVFCAHMMLAAVLYNTGGNLQADDIMDAMERYIHERAGFLMPNFNAVKTERAMRSGDTDAAREWLDVYAYLSDDNLPFYQVCRHFTTLRAYIALKNYEAAVSFGQRLQKMAAGYRRPLDQIESGLLVSIALWHSGERSEAASLFGRTAAIAEPYGFMQLFINEGREALPLLCQLREKKSMPENLMRFIDKLIETISKKYNIKHEEKEAVPELTPQQSAMLSYLSEGMTYGEISKATGIGHGTVKSHVLLVYKKLGVHSAQEAVAKARALGLLDGKS